VVSRLEHVVTDVAREGLQSPALVVVGEVVKFAVTNETQELSRKQA
jgi:siroheme synthase